MKSLIVFFIAYTEQLNKNNSQPAAKYKFSYNDQQLLTCLLACVTDVNEVNSPLAPALYLIVQIFSKKESFCSCRVFSNYLFICCSFYEQYQKRLMNELLGGCF